MSDLLDLIGPRSGGAPLTYTVSELGIVDLQSAFAHFDGTGASGAFLPTLTVRSQNGTLLARVFPSQTLNAGDTADVTWLPFGVETAGGGTALDTTDGSIVVNPTSELLIGSGLQLTNPGAGVARIDIAPLYVQYVVNSPGGFWKLNDAVGSVTAADSSGNGYTLSTANTAPTFGSPAGPPGDTTATFTDATGKTWLRNTSFPAQGAGTAFTVVAWAYYVDSDPASDYWIIGQGVNADRNPSTGWAFTIRGGLNANPGKAHLIVGSGGAPTEIHSNNALTASTWYFLALTYDGTTWRMYVNGVVQTATTAAANTAQSGILVGSDSKNDAAAHFDGRLSWLAIFPTALSASTLASMYVLA